MQTATESNKTDVAMPRSQTYQMMYPDQRMIEAFGTLTPTVSQRTRYFNKQWDEWAENQLLLPAELAYVLRLKVINRLSKLGLEQSWDFIIRDQAVRFRLAEYKALCLIALSEIEWCEES